jgi:hypothetical protein
MKRFGSGLAREGGGTFSVELTDTPLSRASPLPQEFVRLSDPALHRKMAFTT